MNRARYVKLLVALAAVIVAMSTFLSCESAPVPVSPGWQDYIDQLATVSDGSDDSNRMVPLSCEYRVLVEESFSTLLRAPTEWFVLERGGVLGIIDGDPWIIGSSDGSDSYVPYYRTDPSLLLLRPKFLYDLEFDYRVIDEPDQGFETIFYSPLGGAQNNWLPGVVITGPSGSEGRARLRVRTNNFTDYQVRWNVIGSGTIAIRNIRLIESSGGKVVATDSGSHTTQGPSTALCVSGAWSTEVGSDGKTCLRLYGPATISTNPEVVRLAPGEPVMIEFAYTVTKRADELGRAFVAVADRDDVARMGIRLDGGCPDSGIFVGGGTTGRSDLQYLVGFKLWDGVAIAISELRVLRQEPVDADSSSDPAAALAELPFPRLGNYQQGMPEGIANNGCGTAMGSDEWMSIAECERRLALFDVIAGLAEDMTSNDPAFVRRIRRQNPQVVLLPYTIAHEQNWSDRLNGDEVFLSAFDEYRLGLDNQWWLRTSDGNIVEDYDWPGIRKLNVSPYCPIDGRGRVYLDYFVECAVDVHLSNGTWNGLFVDNLFARINPHIPHSFEQARLDVDYTLDGKRNETLPWVHEMTAAASARQMVAVRQRLGDHGLLIANEGSIPERPLAPCLNGFIFEAFNYPWYFNRTANAFSEVGWSRSLSTYRDLERTCRKPTVLIMHATGLHQETVSASRSYREPTPTDIRIQRLAIGTSLLGDGFYEYDLFDARSAPILFDEWSVDQSGHTVHGPEGKGWLGMALGPAVELVSDERVVVELARPVTLSPTMTDRFRAGVSQVLSEEPRQLIIEFDWEVTETLRAPFHMRAVHGDDPDWMWINESVVGAKGHERIHVTLNPGERGYFEFDPTEGGKVVLSNLRIVSAHAGVFRRDFEHGIVLVNATREPKSIQIDRPGVVRIRGVLDPETNDGSVVVGEITIPAADAIVLRAD
jgi:hypothetical protein